MRFALLEAKIVLIEIVSKFRIVLAPETKVSLQCRQDYLLFRYSRVHAIMVYVYIYTTVVYRYIGIIHACMGIEYYCL